MTFVIDLDDASADAGCCLVAKAHGKHPASALAHWVVFSPATADFAGRYAARLWTALPRPKMTETVALADDLGTLRDALPCSLFRIDRDPSDDVNLLEVWM